MQKIQRISISIRVEHNSDLQVECNMSISEEAEEFDKSGKYRRKADLVLRLLEQFKQKYPLKENPESISSLRVEDIFNEGRDYFFRWIVYELKDFG